MGHGLILNSLRFVYKNVKRNKRDSSSFGSFAPSCVSAEFCGENDNKEKVWICYACLVYVPTTISRMKLECV